MVRQVALVPAGCQPWHHDVLASHRERFAYSATLAIYIYEVDHKFNEHRLLSIMSVHKKTITSICWCPERPDYLTSASCDGLIVVWDVTKERQVAAHTHKESVCCLGWSYSEHQCLGFMNKDGPLWLWYVTDSKNMPLVKETNNFSSSVTMFRWHHEKHSCIVFGHEDGSISVLEIGNKVQKHIFRPESVVDSQSLTDPVIALEWDPLSTDYLLLCNRIHGVRLIDIPNQQIIMTFQLPSAASQVQTVAWVKNAPGMFVTGDFKGGILRVWSVSNPAPIENIKIKATGFHRLEVINCHNSRHSNRSTSNNESAVDGNGSNYHHISSTSEAQSSSVVTQAHFTLPHAQIVCTFKDGGVGLYDLGKRKWIFLRDQGHIETIFDCKFHPDNPNHLATASFDGTIKVWDITTMTCVKSSPGNEGIIYHLSWAPADLDCLAACTAKQGTFIWDVQKGKIIKRLTLHAPKTSVYCVAWNHGDPKRIMTCGGDGYCIIQQVNGVLIQKYKHPSAVFGCDWSPFNRDMLATGCEDKALRVYYMASSSDQPIKVFTGHEAKVFHVKWNPLKEGVLCSGSDDGYIRVWDYTKDQCTCILSGHSAPVRGLNWNSEVATLLASGSWDFTIRIWDTQDGACLHCIFDHGADVYGLTSHPSRPFLLASSSRDSTVRLWSTTSLVQSVELNLLAGKTLTDVTGAGEPALSTKSSQSQLLSGRASRDLFNKLSQKSNSLASLLEGFSKFFMHPCGTNNLWDLVSVIRGHDTLTLSSSYSTGIVHQTHITQFKGSEAQQLEMIKMSKFGGGVGALSREDRLKDAAKIHIKLGNVQRYCELMIELGQWERALALAPAVSMTYWQQLNQRYCSALIEEDNDDMIPFSVAGGEVTQLVSFFTARGQVADAAVIAQSACEGSILKPYISSRSESQSHPEKSHEEYNKLVLEVMEKLSDFYFRNGSPVLAACCHLAVDDEKRAMSKLIRGNELELAANIGQVLGGAPRETDIVLELLSRRCETLGKWELGLDLLKLQQKPSIQQAKLCARCSSSMAEINALHHKAGLPSMEACENKAKSLQSSSTDVMECVKFYLLSPVSEKGLEIGLQFVKDKIQSPDWTAKDVHPMLQLLGCIKTEKLQHVKCSEMKHELLTLCAYVGALVAIKRQYFPVVKPLFQHAIDMMRKGNVSLSITERQIEEESCVFGSMLEKRLSKETKSVYKDLLYRSDIGQDWLLEQGVDCVASSHLPSHSDVHISVLSEERVKGQAFFLEDGYSAISLNEALMWAKVNPFSPLGSGVRINPF